MISFTHHAHLIRNRKKTHSEYVNTSKFFTSFLKQFHLQMNYAGLDGTAIPPCQEKCAYFAVPAFQLGGEAGAVRLMTQFRVSRASLSRHPQNTAKAYKPALESSFFPPSTLGT